MKKLFLKNLLALGALSLAACVQAGPANAPLDFSVKEGAVTRTLSVKNWRTDKRGVSSFDYQYRQSGVNCDYQRSGRAVAGFEDLGDNKVELEVFNPEGAGGKASDPIAVYYAADNAVVFSMPVPGKTRKVWVSFEDLVLKKELPKCGHSGQGDAIMFKN